MDFGFELVAAKPKGAVVDPPTQQSMRGGVKVTRNPSTEQKKIRHQLARQGSMAIASLTQSLASLGAADWVSRDQQVTARFERQGNDLVVDVAHPEGFESRRFASMDHEAALRWASSFDVEQRRYAEVADRTVLADARQTLIPRMTPQERAFRAGEEADALAEDLEQDRWEAWDEEARFDAREGSAGPISTGVDDAYEQFGTTVPEPDVGFDMPGVNTRSDALTMNDGDWTATAQRTADLHSVGDEGFQAGADAHRRFEKEHGEYDQVNPGVDDEHFLSAFKDGWRSVRGARVSSMQGSGRTASDQHDPEFWLTYLESLIPAAGGYGDGITVFVEAARAAAAKGINILPRVIEVVNAANRAPDSLTHEDTQGHNMGGAVVDKLLKWQIESGGKGFFASRKHGESLADWPTATKTIESFRAIVRDHSAKMVDGVMVDMQSANAICTVYDALSPANQANFMARPVEQLGTIAWKLLSKHSSRTAKSLPEVVSWCRQWAERAGDASVTHVSGTDLNKLCDIIGQPSDETVRWARRWADSAGTASVTHVSGPDLLKLCDMAQQSIG